MLQVLMVKGPMEQKQLADQCMLPLKEARELLYRMLRSGFVRMFDVPKTQDHAPSRAFFLWEADVERIEAEARHPAATWPAPRGRT